MTVDIVYRNGEYKSKIACQNCGVRVRVGGVIIHSVYNKEHNPYKVAYFAACDTYCQGIVVDRIKETVKNTDWDYEVMDVSTFIAGLIS